MGFSAGLAWGHSCVFSDLVAELGQMVHDKLTPCQAVLLAIICSCALPLRKAGLGFTWLALYSKRMKGKAARSFQAESQESHSITFSPFCRSKIRHRVGPDSRDKGNRCHLFMGWNRKVTLQGGRVRGCKGLLKPSSQKIPATISFCPLACPHTRTPIHITGPHSRS